MTAIPMPAAVERVALVGAGVIGAGWAVRLLAHGQRVAVADPSPHAGDRVRAFIEHARPALTRMGLSGLVDDGWEDRLSVHASPAEAIEVVEATWIQESGPETPAVKAELLAALDALVSSDVVIASSSSGLPPSRLASWCSRHPERVLVGHPFNPAHLIPLVEVVGNDLTAPWASVERAMDFLLFSFGQATQTRPQRTARPYRQQTLRQPCGRRHAPWSRVRRRLRRRHRRGHRTRTGTAMGTAWTARQPAPLRRQSRRACTRARAPRPRPRRSGWTT